MNMKRLIAAVMLLMLLASSAGAELLKSLPMDSYLGGPEPKAEHLIFAKDADDFTETHKIGDNTVVRAPMGYEDDSISVRLYRGRYDHSAKEHTDYIYAHIKISHPSQLRTAPAGMVTSKNKKYVLNEKGNFRSTQTWRGRLVAKVVNAVISINGDYYTKSDKCRVVLRMGQQVRNNANGQNELLVIDKNGDFSSIPPATKADYEAYYNEHKDSMYQVFCWGPVLVRNGVSVIDESYYKNFKAWSNNMGAYKYNQRSVIAQLGPLEYMIFSCNSKEIKNNKGMTLVELAKLCEELGKKLNPENGCVLAYQLDGGNSSTINIPGLDKNSNELKYMKANCPEIERFLGDIIYFATLEK